LKPFWLPFLHLGPAQVTPRELVYRLVAIVKSLGFGIFISILMLFYRYKCSRGRNGRFDCYRPDVFFIVYFVNRIFLICHKAWPSGQGDRLAMNILSEGKSCVGVGSNPAIFVFFFHNVLTCKVQITLQSSINKKSC
jgi:hypothetical protein